MTRIVLLQVGHVHADIVRGSGDYDRLFREAMGLDALDVVRVCDGEALPPVGRYAAAVVTGSLAMVTDREPWSEATAAWLREAIGGGAAVLGVCYGHQLLAHAFGGEVGYNPAGRSSGTVTAELSAEGAGDPLLGVRAGPLGVQVHHSQRVLALPQGAVLLARSPTDPCHAFRLGERAWGVQFHPEFDAAVSRRFVELHADDVAAAGQDPDAVAAAVQDSPDGRDILGRFVAFVG